MSRSGSDSASGSSDLESSASGTEETPKRAPVTNPKEVRLNRAILMKGISSVNCDKREPVEVDKQFPRVTHLHLQNKGIDILGSLHHFRNLTVLYLYDNRIREIVGLENARHLEALYLQRNRLEKISGLLGCRKLRKLYLGQNAILVVEGLHLLNHLEELHIEQQKLQKGEQIIFDPTTLDTLSGCLQILNISGNSLDSLDDLAGMRDLHTIFAQDNDINDLERTSLTFMTLKNLKVVDLRRNPVAKSPKYEEKMIGHCQSIELLDGKTYSSTSRQFMSKFCEMKALHLRRSLASMDMATFLANSNSLKNDSSTGSISENSQSKSSLSSHCQSVSQVPEEDEIDRRVARIGMIGQYSNRKLQSKALDMAHTRGNDLKLVKPQEISLPHFALAQPSMSQNGTCHEAESVPHAGMGVHEGHPLNRQKSKVFKGLGSQGFSALTHLAPASGSFGRRSSMSSSLDGMMPTSQSIGKLKTIEGEGSGSNPGESGDNSKNIGQDGGNSNLGKLPEAKVFKLPPWPHILRNLGTTEKVNFI